MSSVEGEVSLYEAGEVAAHPQPQRLLAIANPTMKLSADEVEILRCRAAPAFTDTLSILASEPRLDPISILIFPDVLEFSDFGLS
ncbi:MAG: hypothetical protein AB1631_24930 [Acidobacteriota bacterium]